MFVDKANGDYSITSSSVCKDAGLTVAWIEDPPLDLAENCRTNGIVDIGGAAKITCEQMARDALARSGDTSKTVVVDPTARYFGATLRPRSLVTAD